MSKKFEIFGGALAAVGGVCLAVVAVAVAALLITWLFVGFAYLIADDQGYIRCNARGYENHETIVHYPNFWNVDTYCYSGKTAKGIEL